MIYVERGRHEGGTRSRERDRVGNDQSALGSESVRVLVGVVGLPSLLLSLLVNLLVKSWSGSIG